MNIMHIKKLLSVSMAIFFVTSASCGFAQTEVTQEAQEPQKPSLVAIDPNDDRNIDPISIPSMMYNNFEEELLREAIIDSRNPRPPPPTDDPIDTVPEEERPPPPPEERYITLSGIVYESADDWVIWLNGMRITPRAIPSEILSLSVGEESVDLKWFDDYTNKIFPIRLRPNQRFNIDMRIFLPG